MKGRYVQPTVEIRGERSAWDPFDEQETTPKEELESWDPFEDLELLELTGDLALEADDVDGLEAWLAQAASKLPWDKVQPKEERLEQLRKAQKDGSGKDEASFAQLKIFMPQEEEEKKRAEKKRLETEAQVSEAEAIKSSAQQKLLRKRHWRSSALWIFDGGDEGSSVGYNML
eukprot:s1371_g9.t1